MRRSLWRRHRWLLWLGGGVLLLLIAFGVAAVIAARHAEPFLRTQIVQRLSDRFHARVELDSFHITVANGLWAEGNGLRIWPPVEVSGVKVPAANESVKPLISLGEFRFHAPLRYTRNKPIHIDRIELRDLAIDIPPRPHFTHTVRPVAPPQPSGVPGIPALQFMLGSIVCTGAELTLESSNPEKLPLEFAIRNIRLTNIQPDGRFDFEAVLTNPRPRGLISTQGSMGPWSIIDPGETPLNGDYRFEDADLSVFRGIAGTLNSIGKFDGSLRDLTVDGSADTPDFSLSDFGNPEPLHTEFHAHVDGTDGDTMLEPVKAVLGQSHFVARGKIVQITSADKATGALHSLGHEISLNIDIEHGAMEDFLRLVSRNGADPLLRGDLRLQTSFDLPPGTEPVQERIKLKGVFQLDSARFSSLSVQQRIAELSLRGQGKPGDIKKTEPNDVLSTMTSSFSMDDAAVRLPDLVYTVPGAEINLHGEYRIDGGGLDFAGTAQMEATVSQMVGGWKGLLLKPADRFFKKDGSGTKVGVMVGGTRDDPHFNVELHAPDGK
jgi:hypothetical protein